MNFVHIAGHLGADPEVRFTSTGKKVTTLRVATHARRGKNNEEQTIWWRVNLWGEQYDKLVSFLKKGSAVIAHGEIHKPEIFNDRDGKPQISMEITADRIEFSPFGKPGGSSNQESHAAPAAPQGVTSPYSSFGSQPAAAPVKGETFDDEVPF